MARTRFVSSMDRNSANAKPCRRGQKGARLSSAHPVLRTEYDGALQTCPLYIRPLAAARLVDARLQARVARRRVEVPRDLRRGRIVASEIEAPNVFVDLV